MPYHLRDAEPARVVARAYACGCRRRRGELGHRRPPARSLAAQPPAFDLEEATIADLQQRMQSGQDTSRSLVDKYLARIEAIDRAGPALHSVIEINPDARAIADRLDAERKSGAARAVRCTASRS